MRPAKRAVKMSVDGKSSKKMGATKEGSQKLLSDENV